MVATQLAAVLDAGARLIFAPDPDRPVFQCPDPATRARLDALLTPDVKPATQALLCHAVAYRDVLRLGFRAMADLVTLSAADAAALLEAHVRLVDELGVPLADVVRLHAAQDWTRETGLCPWCGGPEHEP